MSNLKAGSETHRVTRREAEVTDEVVGGEEAMDGGDWKARLDPGARQRIVNRIIRTLEKVPPFFVQGLSQIVDAGVRFEEKSYAAAAGQKMYDMSTLKHHLPSCGLGEQELEKIAVRMEERVFNASTTQNDYLRKLSMRLLTIESRCQKLAANPLPSNAAHSRHPHPA